MILENDKVFFWNGKSYIVKAGTEVNDEGDKLSVKVGKHKYIGSVEIGDILYVIDYGKNIVLKEVVGISDDTMEFNLYPRNKSDLGINVFWTELEAKRAMVMRYFDRQLEEARNDVREYDKIFHMRQQVLKNSSYDEILNKM